MPHFSTRGAILAIPLLAACSAFGQATAPAPTPAPAAAPATAPDAAAPAAPAAPTWSIGGIDFSGTIDGYYNWNNNHPEDKYNQYYNFDVQANQFSLNMMELTLNHDPDPIGFHVDFGYGKAFQIIHSSTEESDPSAFQYIEQAYVSLKPPKAKGFEADFGEFYTSAGAETVYSKDNWNYSRSLLFTLALPYYHFGLRTTMPITKTMTGGFQLVNGWNNIEDNNSGKTMGFTYAWAKPKYTWNVNYYTGPEKNNTNQGWRNLIDTTVLLTPSSKFSAYLNYDYAQERLLDNSLGHYQGFAGAAHYQVTPAWSISGRGEYFYDPQGFSTGIDQTLDEFTITGEYKWVEGLLARAEYRFDHSNEPVYTRGTTPFASQNQNTLTFGLVGFFGPKR